MKFICMFLYRTKFTWQFTNERALKFFFQSCGLGPPCSVLSYGIWNSGVLEIFMKLRAKPAWDKE